MNGRIWVWGGLTGLALAWFGETGWGQPPTPPGTPVAPAPAASPPPATPASPIQAMPPATTTEPGVVAVVNGSKITGAELQGALKTNGPTPVELPETVRKQRQIEVLGVMIDMMLLHQFLDTNTPAVTAEEVNRSLAELEKGLQSQQKTLAEFCHDTNQTLTQLKSGIADSLRWSTYAAVRINDPVLEQFYKDNKDFFDNVTVRASHIVLRIPEGAPPVEKEKARAKLADLHRQIVAGKLDFAEAAKAYSQDPRAPHGGDLGFFPRKWVFDEQFAKAAFALQKGHISGIVETDYGLHLILVTDRKVGKPSEYAKIKESVREFCMEEMRQQLLNHLRKTAKIEIKLP